MPPAKRRSATGDWPHRRSASPGQPTYVKGHSGTMTAPPSSSRHAVTSGSPGSRRSSRPFVGRGRELEELQEALEEAAAGGGVVVIVTGDAGIGKTRLLTEVADQAGAHGWTVLASRCWEEGGAPAHWPWLPVG